MSQDSVRDVVGLHFGSRSVRSVPFRFGQDFASFAVRSDPIDEQDASHVATTARPASTYGKGEASARSEVHSDERGTAPCHSK